MRSVILAATLSLVAGQALATEISLGRSGSDNVFVWKDSDAQSEAISLIQAGVHKTNPMLVFRLLSCMVPTGTKAIITDLGFASHTIMVIDGEHAGCRGVIPMEDAR